MDDRKNDIEKILEERLKLDSILKSEFTRKVTVMFTDIKGSTSFYEKRGDIDGRVMVHRHNEIVLPLIKENRGLLIKTIGDATMSQYDDPSDAVKTAIEIQKRLYENNRDKSEGEQIHVRTGIHYGDGLVEKNDVYGDVVNVASRVESLADAGQIMVTEDLYRKVKGADDFIFRYFDTVEVKGKEAPIKAYRVIWHEEEISIGKTRKPDAAPSALHTREGLFVIEASISGEKLKVSGFERRDGEEKTVKSYEELNYNKTGIDSYIKGIVDLFNRANSRGRIGSSLIVQLKEYGRLLFDELIPIQIRERLANTDRKHMMISIDDKLVQIPWELLYDGKDFLCQRFNLGRTVSTRQHVAAARRVVSRPVRMQVIADPRGDLNGSYKEGKMLKDEMDAHDDWFDISLRTSSVNADQVKSKIRNYDIVHFAGHAEHNSSRPEESGWILKDGKLDAGQIINMSGAMPMPSLVFSNACQSGQTDEWKLDEDYEDRIFGLANAFLLSGVQHYIGTFWEIPDEACSHFAIHFYKNLVNGVTTGEALRLARGALIEKYGEDIIIWASYMLYGDPTTRYVGGESAVKSEETATRPEEEAVISSTLRRPEEVVQFPLRKKSYSKAVIAGLLLLVIAGLAAMFIKGNSGDKDIVVMPAVESKALSADKAESKKRIDEMVASLAEKYRSGVADNGEAVSDEWTTRPLTMVLMDIQSTGTSGEGKEKLISMLTMSLQEEKRVNMVEREILIKLLEELKLSTSALADPATSLKIGKVLSAQVIVTGNIFPEGKVQLVMLRFIDTETTAVKKVVSAVSGSKEIDMSFANELKNKITDWVNVDFPVRGRIVSIAGDKCRVNLGQMHGLSKGDRLEVINEIPEGSGFYEVTGEIEINEAGNDTSWAVIANKTGSLKEEDKVRWKNQ